MRAKKWSRYGWLGWLGLLTAALIWMAPPAWAQEEEPGLESEEPLSPPPPPPAAPGSGRARRQSPKGQRLHQPGERPVRERPPRERPGLGPGKGLGLAPAAGPGMGQGGGRRGEEALERMKSENPERYQRITKLRELADRYRATADAAEQKRIAEELRPLLDTELKAIQADNAKKLEELEKRLDEEKQKQKERERNWDAYLNYQFSRITGQDDYLQLPLGPWK